jgi:hypothetical protein
MTREQCYDFIVEFSFHLRSNYSRRGLPTAPGGPQNARSSPSSAPSGRPHTAGAPTDTRPPYGIRHATSASIDSPIGPQQRANQYAMPIPENGTDYFMPQLGGDHIYAPSDATVTRQRSMRPPGAGAPYNGAYDDVTQNGSAVGAGDLYHNPHGPMGHRPQPPEQYPAGPAISPATLRPPHGSSPLVSSPGQLQYHPPLDSQYQTPATVLAAADDSYCGSLLFTS